MCERVCVFVCVFECVCVCMRACVSVCVCVWFWEIGGSWPPTEMVIKSNSVYDDFSLQRNFRMEKVGFSVLTSLSKSFRLFVSFSFYNPYTDRTQTHTLSLSLSLILTLTHTQANRHTLKNTKYHRHTRTHTFLF